MKQNCLLILIAIISSTAPAQWHPIGNQKLININVDLGHVGLIGGAGGLYLVSDDVYSSDWHENYYPTSLDITNIHKPNDSTFFLCIADQYGSGPSEIIYSTDNGANWESILSSNHLINDFYCLNDSILLYTCSSGICKYNINSSIENILWSFNDIQALSADITSVFFINDTIGFAAGGISKRNQDGLLYFVKIILKTVDGGSNWNKCFEQQGASMMKLQLCRNNILVGFIREGFSIFISNNLGETWRNENVEALVGSDEGIYGAYYTSEDTGYIASSFYLYYFVETIAHNKIFKTVDGGDTWKLQYMDTLYIDDYLVWEDEQLFRDMYFIDDQTGFVAGNKILLQTDNAGGNDFINAIPDIISADQILVFQNYSGSLLVKLDGVIQQEYKLNVFDINGRLHFSGSVSSENPFNCSALSTGIYIVNLVIQKQRYVVKLPVIR